MSRISKPRIVTQADHLTIRGWSCVKICTILANSPNSQEQTGTIRSCHVLRPARHRRRRGCGFVVDVFSPSAGSIALCRLLAPHTSRGQYNVDSWELVNFYEDASRPDARLDIDGPSVVQLVDTLSVVCCVERSKAIGACCTCACDYSFAKTLRD